jgi:drug/metabolite transporter (DMT)-like permease
MSAAVFSIILFAALLHAAWNAIVKVAPDKTLTAILVAVSAAAVSVVALPFLPQPAAASWPFLAISTVLQVGYYGLVAGAYRAADMSLAYPLMRGFAPLIVAVVTAFALGDHLTGAAWTGVVLVSAGVIATALGAHRSGNGRGAMLAATNAVVIAAYTISDGLGVRASGSPAAYTMWLTILTALPLTAWVLAYRPDFAGYARRYAALGFIGGVSTLTSYGLALWGMTVAPVAVVAALRETAILFGTAIAAFILKERVSPVRLAAVGLIAAGAIALRLA